MEEEGRVFPSGPGDCSTGVRSESEDDVTGNEGHYASTLKEQKREWGIRHRDQDRHDVADQSLGLHGNSQTPCVDGTIAGSASHTPDMRIHSQNLKSLASRSVLRSSSYSLDVRAGKNAHESPTDRLLLRSASHSADLRESNPAPGSHTRRHSLRESCQPCSTERRVHFAGSSESDDDDHSNDVDVGNFKAKQTGSIGRGVSPKTRAAVHHDKGVDTSLFREVVDVIGGTEAFFLLDGVADEGVFDGDGVGGTDSSVRGAKPTSEPVHAGIEHGKGSGEVGHRTDENITSNSEHGMGTDVLGDQEKEALERGKEEGIEVVAQEREKQRKDAEGEKQVEKIITERGKEAGGGTADGKSNSFVEAGGEGHNEFMIQKYQTHDHDQGRGGGGHGANGEAEDLVALARSILRTAEEKKRRQGQAEAKEQMRSLPHGGRRAHFIDIVSGKEGQDRTEGSVPDPSEGSVPPSREGIRMIGEGAEETESEAEQPISPSGRVSLIRTKDDQPEHLRPASEISSSRARATTAASQASSECCRKDLLRLGTGLSFSDGRQATAASSADTEYQQKDSLRQASGLSRDSVAVGAGSRADAYPTAPPSRATNDSASVRPATTASNVRSVCACARNVCTCALDMRVQV